MKVQFSEKYAYKPVTITLESEREFNSVRHALSKYVSSAVAYRPFYEVVKDLLTRLGEAFK